MNYQTTKALAPGTRLDNGRYQIERTIGRGGFGIIYAARNLRMQSKLVAIKELFIDKAHVRREDDLVELLPGSTVDVEQARRRFEAEAICLQTVSGPHLPRVTDTIEENGTRYLVMDYIAGKTLKTLVEESGPMEYRKACQVAAQLTTAMKTLHRSDFYHLDIKPDNLMLGPKGQLTLIDFGSSRKLTADTKSTKNLPAYSPHYSAPELRNGKFFAEKRYAQLDIYSAAGTLYFLLTGDHPPADRTAASQRLDALGLPTRTVRTLMAGLENKSKNRPNSVEEINRAFDPHATLRGGPETDQTRPTIPQETVDAKSKDIPAMTKMALAAGLVVLMVVIGFAVGPNLFSEDDQIADYQSPTKPVVSPVDTTEDDIDDVEPPPGFNSGDEPDDPGNEDKPDDPEKKEESETKPSPKVPVEKLPEIRSIPFSGSISPKIAGRGANYSISMSVQLPVSGMGSFVGTAEVRDRKTGAEEDAKVRGSIQKNKKINFTIRPKGDLCEFTITGIYDGKRAISNEKVSSPNCNVRTVEVNF